MDFLANLKESRENVINDAMNNKKCWIKYAMTASIGDVLIIKQFTDDPVMVKGAEYFMDNLSKFRTYVESAVDAMDMSDIEALMKQDVDLSVLNKPEWMDKSEWEIFCAVFTATMKRFDMVIIQVAGQQIEMALRGIEEVMK